MNKLMQNNSYQNLRARKYLLDEPPEVEVITVACPNCGTRLIVPKELTSLENETPIPCMECNLVSISSEWIIVNDAA